MLFPFPFPIPTFDVKQLLSNEHGHAFDHATTNVLWVIDSEVLKDAVTATNHVLFSVDPMKAIEAMDAGVQVLLSLNSIELMNLVAKEASNATTAALQAGTLVPPDISLDAIKEVADKMSCAVNHDKLSNFTAKVTEAMLSADPKAVAELSSVGLELGFGVRPPKLATVGSKVASGVSSALDWIKARLSG